MRYYKWKERNTAIYLTLAVLAVTLNYFFLLTTTRLKCSCNSDCLSVCLSGRQVGRQAGRKTDRQTDGDRPTDRQRTELTGKYS